MPQKSYAYAVGRVRALERTLISRQALDRMVSAASLSEVARVLSDAGWGEASTQREVERLADEQMLAACRLVREGSPNPDATDCFLLKYDFLNLKLLIKGRVLGEAVDQLSPCGTLDAELLRRAVSENNYASLPRAFRDAIAPIERRIAVEMDPLWVDAELDKAMYKMMSERAGRCGEEAVAAYVRDRADLTNLLIALRVAAMGREEAFARALFVPGGQLPLARLEAVAREPERAQALVLGKPYVRAVAAGLAALQGGAGLAPLEKHIDDYLLARIRPQRYQPTSVLPVIGYLLAREREAAAVRLIATAKASGVDPERLAERLRELYA